MNGITVIGPTGKQSHDDYLTELIHKVWRGDGDRSDLASPPLTPLSELKLIAIGELYEDISEEFDENGSRLVVAEYNLPESVNRDLEMVNYGVAPFVPHLFPVPDSFSVVGESDGKRAVLDLDFYLSKRPGIARTLVGSNKGGLAYKLGAEVFSNFKDISRQNAYHPVSNAGNIIHLSRYFGEREATNTSAGELIFGSKNGSPYKPYNEVILEMMGFVNEHPSFKPERYIMRHHDFKIDFGPEVGKTEFSKQYTLLMERVEREYEKKAQKYKEA